MSVKSLFVDIVESTHNHKLVVLAEKHLSKRVIITDSLVRLIADRIRLRLDTGPWLAGGSVRKLYLNEYLGDSDWDFFFSNDQQFNHAVDTMDKLGINKIIVTENAITFKHYQTGTVIQFIKRLSNDVDDLFNSFDFSVAQCATDGLTYRFGEYTLQDLKSNRLRYIPDHVRSSIIARVIKYRIYGYVMDEELAELLDSNLAYVEFKNDSDGYDA